MIASGKKDKYNKLPAGQLKKAYWGSTLHWLQLGS